MFILLAVALPSVCFADQSSQSATNSFPTPAEVFQGRQFANKLERDVFFLRAIQEKYPTQWPALLEANILGDDYARAPEKLLRFVNELAIAERNRNDAAACAYLVFITDAPQFFTNADVYHPEILQAAAQAMMDIGPNGRGMLAGSFNQLHYRTDSESLEELAKVVAKEKSDDPAFTKALAATAFDFTTTNGGTYPRCTSEMVKDLLSLPNGVAVIKLHLTTNDVIHDPARFQAVIDGIAAAHNRELATNLAALNSSVSAKLTTLTNSPGDYRNDLQDLHSRIEKTLAAFEVPSSAP